MKIKFKKNNNKKNKEKINNKEKYKKINNKIF